MGDPVIASDGFMYEKSSLETLLQTSSHGAFSPMTRERLKNEFVVARQRKGDSMEYREKRGKELLEFATEAVTSQPQMAATALDRVTDYIETLRPSRVPEMTKKAAQLW